jgi:hypothetical protein
MIKFTKFHFFCLFLGLVVIFSFYLLSFFSQQKPTSIVKNFSDCIAAGNQVLETYPAQCKTTDGLTFIQEIGNELEKLDLIKIEHPRPNQEIASPLTITGQARGNWFFEASFPVKLVSDSGQIIAQSYAQAQDEWMTQNFVPFKSNLEFNFGATTTGKLILEKDNPSGLAENADQLWLPVIIKPTLMTVKVFFTTAKTGSEKDFDCLYNESVFRKIPKTPAVALATLDELLKGPTLAEKNAGYSSAINLGVKIQKINIENSIAYVDFDQQLEFQVGGSCRVAAIRQQIVDTLKQFSSIRDVIISIDGRTEDILQP